MTKSLGSQSEGLVREHAFVRTFVVESRVGRSIFEIDSKKKRRLFFSRLCHSFSEVLRMECAEGVDTSKRNAVQLEKFLVQLGAPEKCYVMSFHIEIDCQSVMLREGLEYLEKFGMPVILICTDTLAIFKGEQEIGSAPMLLLRSSRPSRHG